jgi:transposase InsO family protein
VLRRIAQLDPVSSATARDGAEAARPLKSAGGTPPEITGLLEQVQIDHTPVDVIVVDERHRLPIGRPYLTAAIDVCSRCVVGLVVTLNAPSATSVGLCLAHMATDKRAWLERLGVEAVWPMSGKPRELYVDNAAEFKSEALRRGCEEHGIELRYRPPGLPHFGGIVERLIGTMMTLVHELPGTTFSNTAERGTYDSDGKAVLTVAELQRWLTLAVAGYHGQVHDTLGRTPAGVWADKLAESGPAATVTSETAFLVDFLPVIRRTLSRTGFVIDHGSTTATRSSRGSPTVSGWGSSCCAAIPATSAGSGRSPRTATPISRWATGHFPVRRSACGSSRPPSRGCANSAAPRSTRTPCSRWWSRCGRSPTPPRPPPEKSAASRTAARRHRLGPGYRRRLRSPPRPRSPWWRRSR